MIHKLTEQELNYITARILDEDNAAVGGLYGHPTATQDSNPTGSGGTTSNYTSTAQVGTGNNKVTPEQVPQAGGTKTSTAKGNSKTTQVAKKTTFTVMKPYGMK